jgi:hypothetical protein
MVGYRRPFRWIECAIARRSSLIVSKGEVGNERDVKK